jgi:hypothetical protein
LEERLKTKWIKEMIFLGAARNDAADFQHQTVATKIAD